eukprot:gene5430-9243_t
MSQPKRMSIRNSFKGLFSLNKNRSSKSGTTTPITIEEEEQVAISGPIGFQRHVHVGVGEDGEIVGIDNLLGYIAKTDKLEKASWDKLQSQQKELNELTDQKEEESDVTETKKENNFENKIEVIKTNSNSSLLIKENKNNDSISNLHTVKTSGNLKKLNEEEQELAEDKTKKYICNYKNEQERKEHNRTLLVGNPLKVHFTTQKAMEKGMILELNTKKSLDSLEVLLLYYLSTKTFVVEILSEKTPILKEHVVLPLTELVSLRKQGVKTLIIPDLNGDIYLVMNCPQSCLAFRDAFSSKNSKEISK